LEYVYLVGALSADRNKDATFLPVRMCGVYWEIGTSNDAQLNSAIYNERQANGVLTTAQEALRAINGVNRPHA